MPSTEGDRVYAFLNVQMDPLSALSPLLAQLPWGNVPVCASSFTLFTTIRIEKVQPRLDELWDFTVMP